MIKTLAFAGGLCGAVAMSQYPEFAQQYTQRLAGQVDALAEVVADFDNSALEAGLTRAQALEEMTGTAFLDARASDMRRTFVRHAVLSDNLEQLRKATPLQRIAMPHRLADRETFTRTWSDFAPAVPASLAGAAAATAGFGAGWLGLLAILALMSAPLRRSPAAQPDIGRRDPPLQSAPRAVPPTSPRLMGETRP